MKLHKYLKYLRICIKEKSLLSSFLLKLQIQNVFVVITKGLI